MSTLIGFVQKHGILSIAIVFWLASVFTWVTYVVFTSPPDIPTTTATVYSSILGIPATLIAFWKWRAEK